MAMAMDGNGASIAGHLKGRAGDHKVAPTACLVG